MPDTRSDPVRTPHDKFFKETFGRREIAREFFEAYLPPTIAGALDRPRAFPFLAQWLAQPDPSRLVHTLLAYALEADARAPSTLAQVLSKINNEPLKRSVMSIAEQLRQEGRQEGRREGHQEGIVVGRIQICQELLHLPVTRVEELEGKALDDLQGMLRELEVRLRQRP